MFVVVFEYTAICYVGAEAQRSLLVSRGVEAYLLVHKVSVALTHSGVYY